MKYLIKAKGGISEMKCKKSLAIITTIVMVFSSLSGLVSAAQVSDITGHWGEEYIQTLVDKSVINGYEDGTFKPDNSITRAEFCTIITKALVNDGLISYVTPSGIFNDVATGDWFAPYVETAAINNFVLGIGDNKFDPEALITRQEMAKIISLVY